MRVCSPYLFRCGVFIVYFSQGPTTTSCLIDELAPHFLFVVKSPGAGGETTPNIMNYKHLAFVLAAVSLLAGCSVHRLDYREVSTRLIEPNQGALVTPLIADMELVSEEKIQPYTEEFGQLTCQSLSCVEVYKKTALLNAAKKYGADVIVAATIEVETTDSGNLKITVMGFPARYTNFRKATEKDA